MLLGGKLSFDKDEQLNW